MKKRRQRKNRFTLVGLSMLLIASSMLGVFFPLQGEANAAPIKKIIVYTGADAPKPHINRNAVTFGKTPTATTAAIKEDAGAGKKIQKIVFYRGKEAVKTININAQTYNRTEAFTGEAVKVNSTENGSAGSWFAWNRTILSGWTAGGQGDTWTDEGNIPVDSEHIVTKNSGETYDRTYKATPGKKVRLMVRYPITHAFKGEGAFSDLSFPLNIIDNRTSIVQANNPQTPGGGAKIQIDDEKKVSIDNLGISGRGRSDQIAIMSLLVGLDPNQTPGATRDLNFATISFTQYHDDVGGKRYYVEKGPNGEMRPYNANPANAQIMAFYFAAYNFTATSVTYQYPDHYWVYTDKDPGEEPKPPTEVPPGFAGCTIRDGRVVEGERMTPEASAMIRADQRDREVFDVLQGIPTSESLYGSVSANGYLHQYKFKEQLGSCVYDLTVSKTYTLKWQESNATSLPDGKPGPPAVRSRSDTETVRYPVHIERYFSYWVVEKIGIYAIEQAELRNYAFQGESIKIRPAGYVPPALSVTATGTYVSDPGPGNWTASGQSVAGGFAKPSVPNDLNLVAGETERKIKPVQVRNDTVVFNSQPLMNGSPAERKTEDPHKVPEPTRIARDVLYKPNQVIPNRKINRRAAPSSGTITYMPLDANVNAAPGDTYPVGDINPVTVHTPVVNFSGASDDAAHNQKTTPNPARQAFILDRPFTVTLPTYGPHQDYPGYGSRDYAKYFRSKEVRFPFDVYTGDRSVFYPKNTWIDIPVSRLTAEFFLPIWVDEGDYAVDYRNVAENAPASEPAEPGANLDLAHHAASDSVNVEVIGRLYDLHVTDIVDYNWETVFRQRADSPLPTGNTYWVGGQGIDGAARGNSAPFTLPILPGSHPRQGMKNVAVKTGYAFKFDLKTQGNMFGKKDGLRITPSFAFVSRDGKRYAPVDLYYGTDREPFVKVGSPADKAERYVILNERLRNVPEEELGDTARYAYGHHYGFAEMHNVSRRTFVTDYIERFTKMKTPIGGISRLLLPEQLRTLIGPKTDLPAGVDWERANAARQKWYGEYSLPGDPYLVVRGTDLAEYGRTHGGLTRRDPIFLRDGYLIVNFNVESIRDGDVAHPHLQYIHAPLMNQWALEGYARSKQDAWGHRFELRDGDVVFFNADKSYRDDFEVQVPH
ncbi:hypothetical protein FFV09_01590 [Saccharibacillus brassicae]|uniref:DUF5704 domain-containing protein n=2 Tax=Saccharibacillus brassicae TaxID=2583377 RepID=A0A4Y6UTK6_SACBS|nr:hypothetical protein FFV09_01590 [Saccharibacillus brassicae]